MAFQRLYRRTQTSWRFQWADKTVDVNITNLIANDTSPETATLRANNWLAAHVEPGEIMVMRVISISPLEIALLRKTVTGDPAADAIPPEWWVDHSTDAMPPDWYVP